MAQLRAWTPQALLMLTREAEGAELFHPAGSCRLRPPAVKVVDAVGACDASMAGLLYSLISMPDVVPERHLHWAIAAASAACEQVGACRPTVAQIEAMLARMN